MTFKAQITVDVSAALTTALDLEDVASQLAKKLLITLTDGTGANQAVNMFSDTRTLAASANENLDLAGSLVNAFGATITFAKMKAIMIFPAAGNTNDVIVGGAASNGFISPFGSATDTIKVKPGGCLILIAPDVNGYGVTAATADLLKIANSGGGTGVTYDVVLIGV